MKFRDDTNYEHEYNDDYGWRQRYINIYKDDDDEDDGKYIYIKKGQKIYNTRWNEN